MGLKFWGFPAGFALWFLWTAPVGARGVAGRDGGGNRSPGPFWLMRGRARAWAPCSSTVLGRVPKRTPGHTPKRTLKRSQLGTQRSYEGLALHGKSSIPKLTGVKVPNQ